ncbi:hypothetical protein [uncultured Desulfobacter sp.]|uniref:hypothetical protein n=1 Tax=uncultured Desulfobacter sp. TaxID=240139 RepID=UPI002AAABB54|nr:hypothetical protein [uncultured Desulfobacter sp.]
MKLFKIAGILVLGLMLLVPAWAEDDWDAVTGENQIFEKGYIQVISGSEEGQSRYRAIRAAKVVAQRDLLEVIQGLNLDGSSTVNDGMLQSDEIRTSVQGFLKGAVPCGQKFNSDKGFAEVCMRVHLRGKGGLYETLLPLITDKEVASGNKPVYQPPAGATNAVPQGTINTAPQENTAEGKIAAMPTPYDGLIIDTRSFQFRPALVNRILTEKEQVVFDPSKILSNILVERGCGGFTTDDSKAKALLESWGSKNPMVIQTVDVAKQTDAKITQTDATTITVNDQASNLLAQARVVFILK